MIYDYECSNCGDSFEVSQSLSDEPLKKCKKCKKKTLFRVVTGGLGFSISGRTLGALADKNASKYSTEYKDKMVGNKLKKNEEKPWYDSMNNKSAKEINKMDAKDKQRYVENG